MVADFDAELERGKEKIIEMKKQARILQQESEAQHESQLQEFFHVSGLSDFPNLKAYPTDLEDIEEEIFQRFVASIKNKLPKAIPYVVEFNFASREIDEASLSDMTRTPFGQYLYTEFVLDAVVCIPTFSSIKINWESRFNRQIALAAQELEVQLVYLYEKAYAETKMIYWEAEADWDVLLVRAKEQFTPVANARAKGYLELK